MLHHGNIELRKGRRTPQLGSIDSLPCRLRHNRAVSWHTPTVSRAFRFTSSHNVSPPIDLQIPCQALLIQRSRVLPDLRSTAVGSTTIPSQRAREPLQDAPGSPCPTVDYLLTACHPHRRLQRMRPCGSSKSTFKRKIQTHAGTHRLEPLASGTIIPCVPR